MKRPKIVCDWSSAPYPAGGAYDRRSPDSLVGYGGGRPLLHTSPLECLDAFHRCSWTFVGAGRKDGHWTQPIFLKGGCALAKYAHKVNCL